ncbi:MAG: M20 family peptidase, partial [Candidatus Bipolaricaulia bacterium]
MEDQLHQIVELLQDLIRIDSTNPPGNEDRIAGFIAEYLAEAGIDCQLVRLEEGRSSVVGMIPGKGRGNIALCGHIDTVRVKEERWSYLPF